MNFFEQQDIARRNTIKLVVLLALAVLSLIAAATVLLATLLFSQDIGSWQSWGWQLTGSIAAVVCTVVLLGSLYKLSQLRGGGRVVAEALGGKRIQYHTDDPDERRVLNVVEEMAIASGIAVPQVYVLEDSSINAFAAGYSHHDAVIGITRGAIRLLNRDELQGVVAHEFSHIFHGDMRLNMRLVALLNGILLIGLMGYVILRGSGRIRVSGGRNSGGAIIAIFILGLGLMVLGYAGTFFGNLIKAAVSRQREFLADASAVQYTRNPAGIAGALKKIGGHSFGSELASAGAAEYSHMYFSQGIASSFNALMATHPPLRERIKRVEPQWDGKLPAVAPPRAQPSAGPGSEQISGFSAPAAATGAVTLDTLEKSVDAIGEPSVEHLAQARNTLTALPAVLRDAAHEPFAARALVYALLLSEDLAVRRQQLQELETGALPQTVRELNQLLPHLTLLTPAQRLPLLELALPTLKQQSAEQYRVFKHCLVQLIRADQRISLTEWSLYRILCRNLEERRPALGSYNLRKLRSQCRLVLTVMARAGNDSEEEAASAFAAAAASLQMSELSLLPREESGLARLDQALEDLNQIKPLQKPGLLKAIGLCVTHDGRVTPTEAELFRAIADCLDCPLPPILGN